MKLVLGCVRRADEDFGMIEAGDRVAVGVSGGKDSLLLLHAMALYRKFCKQPFELSAVTLTMGIGEFDVDAIQRMCDELEVPYIVKHTDILDVVLNERKEKNPCALCAKMRRGALTDLCNEHGFNKLALGHHADDAIETLLLSLFYEGRLHTFHPVTHLSRSGITQIRPMVYLPESHVIHMQRKMNLPVVKSPCPANGHTKREEMKELLRYMSKNVVPNVRQQMLTALRNDERYGLWDKKIDVTDPR